MAAKPDTWMPLYWGDYLRDTMHLRAEGHGAYLLLIAHYWTTGQPLPDDDDYLIAVSRLEAKTWKKLKPTLAKFFTVADGTWTQERVEAELAKADKITTAKSEAGLAGAKKRWQKNGKGNDSKDGKGSSKPDGKKDGTAIADASNSQWQTDAPSQSPSPVQSTATTTETVSARASPGPKADAALGLIQAFDRTLTAAWGANRARPWPAGNDLAKARDWLASGVTADDLAVLLGSRMQRMAADGKEPPKSLAYFGQAIREYLKSGKALPEAGSAPVAEAEPLSAEEALERENMVRRAAGKRPRLPSGAIDWDAPEPSDGVTDFLPIPPEFDRRTKKEPADGKP
ncbi:YdaU family protein [Pelagibius litoralis]|uniref:YdaU family protein n=1 Tax=Pelagibius litoralis TaxID=374515 RepID=A0A967F311_9PROT|nr:DUF1376 domain-containing protein [Pelagibius litoralis]NIA72288.1 YdaU family protein [Pelagibius litoralis]